MPNEPIPFSAVQKQELEHLTPQGAPLTALCLSGGGIRSATFALGVLQGMAKKGLLREFHYLSTVSGGGYIGGWLTAWAKNQGVSSVLDGLAQEDEAEPIRHLRQYSNYLSPSVGLFSADSWTLAATFLRNLFLNWLILLPMLVAALLLPRLAVALLVPPRDEQAAWFVLGGACLLTVYSISRVATWLPSLRREDGGYSEFSFVLEHIIPLMLSAYLFGIAWYWLLVEYADKQLPVNPLWMLGLLGAVVNAFGWAIGFAQSRPRMPAASWLTVVLVIIGLGFAGGCLLYLFGTTQFAKYLLNDPLLFTTATPPLVIGMLLVAAFVFVGLGSFREVIQDQDREWWARSAAWLLILAVGWAVFCGITLFGPRLLMLAGEGVAALWTAAGGSLSGVIAAWIGWNPLTRASTKTGKEDKPSAWAIMVSQLAEKVLAPVFAVTLVAGLSLVVSVVDGSAITWYTHDAALRTASPWVVAGWTVFLFALGYLIGWLFSVNRFSLNAMYRNRLIRAYLGASRRDRNPNPLTGFDNRDNVLMAEVKVKKPIHILNLALNVTCGEELAWQQRKATSFTISCLHAGFGNHYQPSGQYTDAGGISLGTAVSVSGAAASPNMGYHSSRALTFLMALFNARLGAWLPNPLQTDKDLLARGGPNSPLVLLWEMLGLTSARGEWVYLSDGGHFENLGLYEMARRHCRLIVVSDAGADPKYEYEDLANAIQKIRVDLGAAIEFVARPPMHNQRDTAGSHAAVLEIRYADGTRGMILYIKPALSGCEAICSPDVYKYAGEHADFPHQSTGDQFFNETQFESYRRLGEQSIEAITDGWDQRTGLRGLIEDVRVKITGLEPKRRVASA